MCGCTYCPGAPKGGHLGNARLDVFRVPARNRLSPGRPGIRGGPMKRVAGLVVVGLILFLYVPSARSVMCPASRQPSVACDASGNCFRHCCISSGICPAFSCTTSLDLQSDRGTICAGNCRQELMCRPFSVDCVSDGTEVCIGTTVCKTADCAGRRAGELCLIAPGGAVKICAGAE